MAIGVYDSGIGGLTVFRAIASKLPDLDMIYLGDSARVPYGNKSPENIIKYSLECTKYLTSHYKLSCIVIACNTISSYALEHLNNELQIPVLGVIEPGAKNAIDVTKNNKIGVLGTQATVNSKAYINTIRSLTTKNIEIHQKACPLFVPLAENAIISGKIADVVVEETLADIVDLDLDTIVLACTHFPVLKPVIQKFLPNAAFVDSTNYITEDIKKLNIELSENAKRKILVTDESDAFYFLKNLLVGDIPVELIQI